MSGTNSVRAEDPANAGRLINLNIEYFNGYFSNFRVWNRALQPGEISRLYSDQWAGTALPSLPRVYLPNSAPCFVPQVTVLM